MGTPSRGGRTPADAIFSSPKYRATDGRARPESRAVDRRAPNASHTPATHVGVPSKCNHSRLTGSPGIPR